MEHGHRVGRSGTEGAFDCGNTCVLQSCLIGCTCSNTLCLTIGRNWKERVVSSVAGAEEPRSMNSSSSSHPEDRHLAASWPDTRRSRRAAAASGDGDYLLGYVPTASSSIRSRAIDCIGKAK